MTRMTFLALALGAGLAAGPLAAGPAPEPAPITTDPTQVRSGAYRLDPAHGKITWSVGHLGFSTYYGQITDVAATAVLDSREPGKSRLAVTVRVASLNALDDALNRNLWGPDFFDAAKFPTATFASTSVEATSPTTARINGDLTLKGVTRPVSLDATFNQAGLNPVDRLYSVGFDGRAVLRRSDFGISAFLPGVGDEVTLRLEGEFKAAD